MFLDLREPPITGTFVKNMSNLDLQFINVNDLDTTLFIPRKYCFLFFFKNFESVVPYGVVDFSNNLW